MPPKRKGAKGGKGATGNKRQKVDDSKKKGKKEPSKTSSKAKAAPLKKTSSKATPEDYVGPGDYNVLENLTEQSWRDKLNDEFQQQYFKDLQESLTAQAAANIEIFPPQELVFTALNLTPFDQQWVKVVILGQDPYHDNDQAHGLAFSVQTGVKTPPSLRNIYKELETDIKGFMAPDHGNLEKWAERGILLLNTTLTVQAHKANSHSKLGWQKFTDAIISRISQDRSGVVFILWGGFAQKKEKLIEADDPEKHGIVKAAHPSGLSFHLFRNCKCFSKANELLKGFGKEPIDWTL